MTKRLKGHNQKRKTMKEHIITFVIVIVAVLAAQFLATKVLHLNTYDEYEEFEGN